MAGRRVRRNPPLPSAPAKRRLPGAARTQGAAPLGSSLARVRKLARDLPENERSFSPERPGTWRGSSRDLVVNGSQTIKGVRLDPFTIGFLVAALWSSNDESDDNGGEPLDANYSIHDFTKEALVDLAADCERFQEENADALSATGADDEQLGHDYWLTRNGHGTGFWDRDYPKTAEKKLTEASERAGEVNLYVTDDGEVGCDISRPMARNARGARGSMRKNSYELSFSPEFFFAEGEPYDGGPDLPAKKPISVWSAIETMRLADPDRWADLAKEVFDLDRPDYLTPEAVMDKVQETNTCGDLSSPVDVYIDPDGYFTLDVYDDMSRNGRRGMRRNSTEIPMPDFDWEQIDGDVNLGSYGGIIARCEGGQIDLVEIQPVREYVGDGEAADVGFPFWTKEASYDASDLNQSNEEVRSALQSSEVDLDTIEPEWRARAIAIACMRYGHGSEEGNGGWAGDKQPSEGGRGNLLGSRRVRWSYAGSKRTTFAEECGDEDDEFRREVLGEEDEDEE